MGDGPKTRGWWPPLVFTLAAVCQGIYLFGAHSPTLVGLAFSLMSIGAVMTLGDYLYERGRKSARSLPGKLFSDGEDRSE